MIVEPDFLDHWKTQLLARLLGTDKAPIYVLRLWAHCQQRKTGRFTGWNPDVLASVCRWDGDGLTLWKAMMQTYLEQDGDEVVAHGWIEANAGLVAAWSNGKLGGRPRKSGQKKPTENPAVNQPVTCGVSDEIDKIEKIDTTSSASQAPIEKPKSKRARNPLMDWLAGMFGANLDEITPAGWSGFRKVLTEIQSVTPDVTVDEMARRAKNLELKWGFQPTAHALAKHWAEANLMPERPKSSTAQARPAFIVARELEAKIACHPANFNWVGYDKSKVTDAMKQELSALKRELDLVRGGAQ